MHDLIILSFSIFLLFFNNQMERSESEAGNKPALQLSDEIRTQPELMIH